MQLWCCCADGKQLILYGGEGHEMIDGGENQPPYVYTFDVASLTWHRRPTFCSLPEHSPGVRSLHLSTVRASHAHGCLLSKWSHKLPLPAIALRCVPHNALTHAHSCLQCAQMHMHMCLTARTAASAGSHGLANQCNCCLRVSSQQQCKP